MAIIRQSSRTDIPDKIADTESLVNDSRADLKSDGWRKSSLIPNWHTGTAYKYIISQWNQYVLI